MTQFPRMQKISILGCGWLGLPLATSLISKGHQINGSTTKVEKCEILEAAGIAPFLVTLKSDAIDGNISKFLENTAILIIDIPPRLKEFGSFADRISLIKQHIIDSEVSKVLLISSTAVYADTNSLVDENTPEMPQSESGRELVMAEKILMEEPNFTTTVLRFGGLIGEDRHPIYSLSGKENIANPNAPINLIHLKDCIGIIESIIEKKIWGEKLNAVSPYHPSRREYYCAKAAENDLPAPVFNDDAPSVGKTITCAKVIELLGYKFLVPNL